LLLELSIGPNAGHLCAGSTGDFAKKGIRWIEDWGKTDVRRLQMSDKGMRRKKKKLVDRFQNVVPEKNFRMPMKKIRSHGRRGAKNQR